MGTIETVLMGSEGTFIITLDTSYSALKIVFLIVVILTGTVGFEENGV